MPQPTAEGPASARQEGSRLQPPIAKLIGFEVEQIGEGRAVIVLEPGPRHANVHSSRRCFCAMSLTRRWE